MRYSTGSARRFSPALLALFALLLWPHGAAAAPAAAAQWAYISGFPSVRQWYNLSCEYAAAAAVTLFYGPVVSQSVFLRETPKNANPHLGFRGAINGPIGGLTDYGVYAEPLVPVLENHGYNATVFYGGVDRLKAELSAGHPVVVWLTTGQQARPLYNRTIDGQTFRLVPGEHAVVAHGYNAGGIDLMDVGNGKFYHTAWSSFLRRWGYFDEMSLVITPR